MENNIKHKISILGLKEIVETKDRYTNYKTLEIKTLSFTIEDEIAEIIKKEAEENFMTVSQYMRKLMTEKYKPNKEE